MSRIAFIDCQVAGISGDMFLGALLDLGANHDRVISAIKLVPKFLRGCSGIEVNISKTTRCELRATQVQILPNEVDEPRSGKEVLDATIACTKELPISQEAKEFAIKVVRSIVEAESRVHGEHPDHLHLHEIGSADTLADAIGSAVACEDLGLIRDCQWFCSPIAVGGGQVTSVHGTMSVPPPAVLEIAKSNNFQIRGGPFDFELTTPTGASIIASLGVKFTSFLPSVRNIRVGYGAGMKNFPNLPNILRIIIGDRDTPNGRSYNLVEEMVAVLETNVDDVSGEIIGQTVDVLFEKGAKDVSVIPVVTKKGRPGQIIKVISSLDDVPKLSRILIDETGSLGVRVTPTPRLVLKREIDTARITIEGKSYEFRLKIARDTSGKIIRMKPEFEDLKKIAKETNLPIRHIIAKVLKNTSKE
jgi:uncharacterized protein (TIGR00299 family) protein